MIENPKIPDNLGPCKNCRHWAKEAAQEFVMIPGQPTPMPSSSLGATLAPRGSRRLNCAPCMFLPAWQLTGDAAFCWQWVERPAID